MTNEELRAKVLARFEGRDYVPDGPPRFAWHVHHKVLIESLTEPIANRVDYILVNKPAGEIAIRLEWLRPLTGQLPPKCDKAQAECDKARVECVKARAEYDKAQAEHDKAWVENAKARVENAKEVEALHSQELPACPWNGVELVLD